MKILEGARDRDFFIKMGTNSYREVVYGRGVRHCFTLAIYGFSRNNALYSAGLSFTFSFFLTFFDTKYCYFESNLSLALLIKVTTRLFHGSSIAWSQFSYDYIY